MSRCRCRRCRMRVCRSAGLASRHCLQSRRFEPRKIRRRFGPAKLWCGQYVRIDRTLCFQRYWIRPLFCCGINTLIPGLPPAHDPFCLCVPSLFFVRVRCVISMKMYILGILLHISILRKEFPKGARVEFLRGERVDIGCRCRVWRRSMIKIESVRGWAGGRCSNAELCSETTYKSGMFW